MRTSLLLLASLLLLLLATRAHGIRLDRQLHEAINNKKDMDDSKAGQPSNTAQSMNKHCTSDGNCSDAGKAKKALAHAESGEARQQSSKTNDDTTSQNRQEAEVTSHGGGQEEAAVSRGAAPRVPRHPQTTYPDILDIAGMDYSPATRKPPIHN